MNMARGNHNSSRCARKLPRSLQREGSRNEVSTRRNTVDIRSRQSICQHERFPEIRRAGDFSVHTIRDEAIPLNPWEHNEAGPNHSSLQSRWNISCLSVLSGRVRAPETIQILILLVNQGADE